MGNVPVTDPVSLETARVRLPSAEPAQAAEWRPTAGPSGPQLSVIVPTFNERSNVEALIAVVRAALADVPFELIFVDDNSPDGTAELLKSIAQQDPAVRCIHRIGRRGLSSAVTEGILSSSAPFVAVIDADLQHDETRLPLMLELLLRGDAEVVVGSRYVAGGGIGAWSARRAWMSRLATRLARLVMGADISDPMSGFFMTRRTLFNAAAPNLSLEGYKILLDYLASSPTKLATAEVPYEFRQRLSGESKIDSMVLWEYGMLLVDKLFGGVIPPRFLMFCFVGGTGVLVHLGVLAALHEGFSLNFEAAQTAALIVAMTTNFLLNNWLTYRDKRLRGWRALRGLLSFYAICSVGAIANVGIASFLFAGEYAGWAIAGLAGILVGTVFNFALSSIFTWRSRK